MKTILCFVVSFCIYVDGIRHFSEVEKGKLPSIVAVGKYAKPSFNSFCAAFIIHPEWIVGQSSKKGCDISNMEYVAFGTISFNDIKETDIRKIKRVNFTQEESTDMVKGFFVAQLEKPLEMNNLTKTSVFAVYGKTYNSMNFENIFLLTFKNDQLRQYNNSEYFGKVCSSASKNKGTICALYAPWISNKEFEGSVMMSSTGEAIGAFWRFVFYKTYPLIAYVDIRVYESWIAEMSGVQIQYASLDEDPEKDVIVHSNY